ncbi:ATP-binding protein [Pelagicoccus mobilis]|uniref:histidine kinase n=1 Tax=Pelagicoccus mobilis TaxID=415221 RepID=A0A934S222_9BACT|nr:ATP-binding protein [Pelagicoccus mobilis]MBK1877638.1 response regulator [Pelagicoccus mobilis]
MDSKEQHISVLTRAARGILCGFAVWIVCLHEGWSVEPYEPKISVSIGEQWRWTEIELVSDLNYRNAVEGIGGDIWFRKSQEIARFNGSELRRYELEGENIENETIVSHFLSESGLVYVLTTQRMLQLVDEEWVTLFERKGTGSGQAGVAFVGGMNASDEERLWVAEGGRIYRIEKGEVLSFETEIGTVRTLLVDRNGRIWTTDAEDGKVRVFEFVEDQLVLFKEFVMPFRNQIGVPMTQDGRGRIWMRRTHLDGACYFFEDYQMKSVPWGNRFSNDREIGFDVADYDGERTLLLFPRRLIVADGEELEVYSTRELPIPRSSSFLLKLSDGRFVVGGRESKSYIVDLSSDKWATFEELNYQCVDKSGVEWFLDHDARLISYDAEADSWLVHDKSDGVIDNPNLVSLSSDGTLWLSGQHEGQAAVSYREEGEWRLESFFEEDSRLSYMGFFELRDGSVVFGDGTPRPKNVRGGGVVVFKKLSGEWVSSQLEPPVFPPRVASIVEREDDGLWVAALGLERPWFGDRKSNGKTETLFARRWVDHIIVDSKNDLWVALWGSGVHRFDGEKWIRYSSRDGLSSPEVAYLAEGEGALWAATSEGLSRFDGQSWSNFDMPAGYLFDRESCTLRLEENGVLWMNFSYRSWLIEGAPSESREQLFRTVRYRRDLNAPDTQILGADRRVPEGSQVLVDWTGVDSWSDTAKDELEFSWRLGEGDWSPFTRGTNVALDDIGSGSRTFEVRARDRDWNVDTTPAKIAIVVVPPVWKRGWFIALVCVVGATLVYLVYALFKARVQTALAMEEFKLDFFTNISHELLNPLSVIVGPLESLLRSKQNEKNEGNLKLALGNARKMQALLRQLLQFRKAEMGKIAVRPVRGEVVGFVRDAVQCESPLWEAKGQDVKVFCSDEYCECEYDGEKLQQVIDNLVSNAIKYTAEGGEVVVRLDLKPEGTGKVARLTVEDGGVGIPEHEINLVLEPFYRVNKSRTYAEGFGIGLSYAKQLVELMGGMLEIESPIGRGQGGTRVIVELPLKEVSVRPDEEREDLEHDLLEESVSHGEGDMPNLLFVEDNEDVRRFLRNEFSESFSVHEAANGKEGLEIARVVDLDLIVSDVMMPEMDGFELCRRLKENADTSHIPIILLTARGAEEHRVKGAQVGADAYYAKPVNVVRLEAQIENLLELRRRLKKRFAEQVVIEPSDVTVNKTDEMMFRKAIEIVDANMDDETFDVDQFASQMGMSRATLYRKLKALTGQTPSPFIRTMRLKRAAQLLGDGGMTVSETLVHVGISDLSYFGRIFKKEFGVAPSHYKTKQSS